MDYYPFMASAVNRWVSIEASPEVVFAYLAGLSSHGEWDELSRFVVVGITERPVAKDLLVTDNGRKSSNHPY